MAGLSGNREGGRCGEVVRSDTEGAFSCELCQPGEFVQIDGHSGTVMELHREAEIYRLYFQGSGIGGAFILSRT